MIYGNRAITLKRDFNPPFVGYSLQSKAQKEDMLRVYADENGKPYKKAGKIDYVAGWYFKAAHFICGTKIRAAFVSTNSITQGEQVSDVWKPLYERFGVHIDFAHRTFRWNSESSDKAAVHVVIVGFSTTENGTEKRLYSGGQAQPAKNISPYLVDAPTVFVESLSKPLCNVPPMVKGNQPTDDGNFFMTREEREQILKQEPNLAKYIRRVYGSKEYINNLERYCFWLVGANPHDIKNSPVLRERVQKVKDFRLASPKTATQKSADTPTLF